MAGLSSVAEAAAGDARSTCVDSRPKTPQTAARQNTDSLAEMLSPQKTPTAVKPLRMPVAEMHPSKVHPSTTKQPDSGLILGFNPMKKDASGNVVTESIAQSTPSKVKMVSATSNDLGAAGFDLSFAAQDSQLSDEAKRLMDSVRGDVARIKAQMIHEKQQELHSCTQVGSHKDGSGGERKFAKPKGKAGRFSQAHMAEFKKMDSIAGHASAFRAAPERLEPVYKPLKRTNSKMHLDEPEAADALSSASPAKGGSMIPLSRPDAKRVKHRANDDTAAALSVSRDGKPLKNGAGASQAVTGKSALPSALVSPVKPTIARSASVRSNKTAMPPAAPRTPRTEFNPRLKSHMPAMSNLRSILRRHQPLFSRDPAKIAAGTHVAAPDFTKEMLLPKLCASPTARLVQSPSPKKHVEFSASVKSPCGGSLAALQSPLMASTASPTAAAAAAAAATAAQIVYPALPDFTPEKEDTVAESPTANKGASSAQKRFAPDTSPLRHRTAVSASAPVAACFSRLPAVPHGINNKKRHRAEADEDDTTDAENIPPAGSSASQARSGAKRLKMSAASTISSSSSSSSSSFSSPLKTIRPVSPVKARSFTPSRATPKRRDTPSTAQKAKGVLSLSRLHMLAKPKDRR